jgi:glycosyltransferase involved in cell wall biosynthesis
LASEGLKSDVSRHAPRVIYYGVDDWSKYPGVDPAWVLDCERRLLARADTVFAASRYLEARWRPVAGHRVHYMPHGVWHGAFAAALDADLRVPEEVASLPAPRVGFYGNLYDWIDFDLLDRLAAARPRWSFVMIGPVYCDITRLRHRANVHFLGRRTPEQLPACCKGFDVALIPYKLSDARMESVNPVKLRELLAAGVPVVSSDIPEVRDISRYVATARTTEAFLTALDAAIAAGYDRADISRERLADDWSARVREIRRIIGGVL